MDSVVARCTFCGRRYALSIEELDVWFVRCECGACGFTQDEAELVEFGYEGVGFTVQEIEDVLGSPVLMADPVPVFVNERCCWVYVCWYMTRG
jgi:hypothetical protein